MGLTLDHVPFAWHDLDEVTEEFDRIGLTPEYGGVHSNGATHMSILGFDNLSYVEVLSEYEDGTHRFWSDHIAANAGPAAWSIRVSDIVAACKRALEAGQVVHGPLYGNRERDDGPLVEWDRAEIGATDQRLLLPFLVQDRTPLSHRVQPSPSVAGGPLCGIGQVVCAVEDLNRAMSLFRDVYSFPQPMRESVAGFGEVASFPGQPLALATPTADAENPGDQEWLVGRLNRYRESPCTYLLETDDFEAARERYPLLDQQGWPEGRIALFDSKLGNRLGVIERESA